VITLEQLANGNINVPISYGWTNDFQTTFERIRKLKTKECSKRVVFNMIQVVDIGSDERIMKKNNITPDLATHFALAMKEDESVNDMLIFILGDVVGSPAFKLYYHYAIQHMNSEAVTGQNLIGTTADLGRAMGVTETQLEIKKVPPRFIIIGSIGEIPKDMNGSAFYLDCIDNKVESTNPITSGLNKIESDYIQQMLKALKPEEHKKWNVVSDLRKGVFSGSKVIKDITICEHADNIGGYTAAKRYFQARKKYLAQEKGMIKISGDLFVGPAGTGRLVA